jgi:hypothetical protein
LDIPEVRPAIPELGLNGNWFDRLIIEILP